MHAALALRGRGPVPAGRCSHHVPFVPGDPRRGPLHAGPGQGPDRDVPRDGAGVPRLDVATWRNEEVREALDLCLVLQGVRVRLPDPRRHGDVQVGVLLALLQGPAAPAGHVRHGPAPLGRPGATASPRRPARSGQCRSGFAARLAGAKTPRRYDHRPPGASLCHAEAGSLRGEFPGGHCDRAPARATSVVVWPDTFTNAFNPGRGTRPSSRPSTRPGRDRWPFHPAGLAAGVRCTTSACSTWPNGALRRLSTSWGRGPARMSPWLCPSRVAWLRSATSCRRSCPGTHAPPGWPRWPVARPSTWSSPAIWHRWRPRRTGVAAGRCCTPTATSARSSVPAPNRQSCWAARFPVEVLDAGCCGLAGSFGFDADHEAVSRKIGEELWLPKVRVALSAETGKAGSASCEGRSYLTRESRSYLVVDGFSCRAQFGAPRPGPARAHNHPGGVGTFTSHS